MITIITRLIASICLISTPFEFALEYPLWVFVVTSAVGIVALMVSAVHDYIEKRQAETKKLLAEA